MLAMNKKRLPSLRLRTFLPVVLILIWFVVAGIGGPTFAKIASVSTNDFSSFLPTSSDATKVNSIQATFYNSQDIPGIIVAESNAIISPDTYSAYGTLKDTIATIPGIDGGKIAGPIPSKDGKAIEIIVPISATGKDVQTVIASMRADLTGNLPSGVTGYVTGPAGFSADLGKAFNGIDGILLYVAIAAVFVILLFVYRSLILPFLVLFTSLFALCASILLVYELAKHGTIKLNQESQGILSILVIGAATDYSLLIIARYREALIKRESKYEAIMEAWKVSIEPIAASAATVILALLCLLVSKLNSNHSLGPIASIGIVFAFLASMTFLPALLVVFGRASFWPFQPQHTAQVAAEHGSQMALGLEGLSGLWRRVGGFIADHARTVWSISLLLLLLGATGLFQLKASGISQSDLILGKSDSVNGQNVIDAHFDAGSGSPTVIVTTPAKMTAVLKVVNATAGVSTASPVLVPNPCAVTDANKAICTIAYFPAPVVVNGQVLINATLAYDPNSTEAQNVVSALRTNLKNVDSQALVGGTTAIALDTNLTSKSDIKKIIPLVLGVILLVLILLLRSIVAPFLLIGTVVVSFAASLGVAALVFNHLFHFPGSDPSVPLFGFVFLVALGIDYNIFLMTRVREESMKLGSRAGILRGLGETGSVITSAGVVLAATFAALGVIPILFLIQIAFIVAFGVLLDTVVVRSLLVPALAYDLGGKIWWPSRLGRK